MTIEFANNATTTLASSISKNTTNIAIAAGDGALFPDTTAGIEFPVTIVNASGDIEICRCTARSGDVLTVNRGQEATAKRTFNAGDRLELRITAKSLKEFKPDNATHADTADNATHADTADNVTYADTATEQMYKSQVTKGILMLKEQ